MEVIVLLVCVNTSNIYANTLDVYTRRKHSMEPWFKGEAIETYKIRKKSTSITLRYRIQ